MRCISPFMVCCTRGYAHVQFAKGKAKSVEQALSKDGEYLNFRYLSIKRANAPKEFTQVAAAPTTADANCRTVFVKNLPYDIKEDDVSSAFAQFGKIASVRLAMWNHTQALKGFGYVEFKKPSSASNAVKKTDLRINGRLVYIDYESGAPKASFRTQEGRQWLKQDEAAATKREMHGGKGAGGGGRGGGKGKEGNRFQMGGRGKGKGTRVPLPGLSFPVFFPPSSLPPFLPSLLDIPPSFLDIPPSILHFLPPSLLTKGKGTRAFPFRKFLFPIFFF
jgi:hypothetical protein